MNLIQINRRDQGKLNGNFTFTKYNSMRKRPDKVVVENFYSRKPCFLWTFQLSFIIKQKIPLMSLDRIMDSESDHEAQAVAISFSSLLLVVTIAGDSNKYTYDQPIFLIPEMDCIRILSSVCHEIIQKVPKCVNNIFAINSQEPSSWLFEAHKKYTVIETD